MHRVYRLETTIA